MRVSQVVKALVDSSSSWNYARLAKNLGVTQSALVNRFNRATQPHVESCVEMLSALDYELAVIPKGSKLPEGSYLITNDD